MPAPTKSSGRRVMVVTSDTQYRRDLCALLRRRAYNAVPVESLEHLAEHMEGRESDIVILDLDGLPVENRFLRQLRRDSPGLQIIALSSRPFHPELEEAMSSHIYACLGRPPDPDELAYCLGSMCANALTQEKNATGADESL